MSLRAGSNMATTTNAALAAHRAGLHPSHARLRVRDLARVSDWYERVLGLERLSGDAGSVLLGSGGIGYLTLAGDPALTIAPRGAAGLFHIAYLVPERADLLAWLAAALERGVVLTGQADHLVSEALYLDDPEGNGIEVYADKPVETWIWREGHVEMANVRMDIPAMVAEGRRYGSRGERLAPGTRIGHVHLKVGAIEPAERLYAEALGFDVTMRRPQASFLATGGYHHHLAVNTWSSEGAGVRGAGETGLERWDLVATDAATFAATSARLIAAGGCRVGEGVEIEDAWGTRLRVVPA